MFTAFIHFALIAEALTPQLAQLSLGVLAPHRTPDLSFSAPDDPC